MASEVLKLAAEIVSSHASMRELTPKELVKEIKEVFNLLSSLEVKEAVPETAGPAGRVPKARRVKMVESTEAKAIENENGPVLGERDYIEFMDSREG